MTEREDSAAGGSRLLFDELVDLGPDERAARLARLDPNDPDVVRLLRLLDAHDHATARLDPLGFLRARDAWGGVSSSFDAVTAFAPTYSIEGELHGGGMSRVFFGRDARLGRKIVAKLLPPELGAEVGLARFQQEIRLAAQLRHPHVVPLLESGEAAGCLYYTMPFIEGESLRHRLRRDGTLSLPVALRIATDIADALTYAHGLGVIHCDIKPGNVLIDSGHAVVTDFGIARALSDATMWTDAHSSTSSTVMGTPTYMSPEQASPGGVVDVRTDVYSLGCVLHEMLYGAPPAAAAIAPSPVERASSVRVPSRVRAIVARATAARPADRFQSAQEMREALLAEAAPRIGPRAFWTTVTACVALIVGGSLALRSPVDHSFASPQAVIRQVTTRGDVKLAAITPGGAYVAFVTSDTVVLRMGEIDAGTEAAMDIGTRTGPPEPWIIRQLAWNRDGTILYWLGEPYQDVNALTKLGPWRSAIANPLLAQAHPLFGYYQPLTGFAPSSVDSSIAIWHAPRVGTDERRAVIYREYLNSVRMDTIGVRVDMQWGTLSFSPSGRWLAACGGSRDHGAWRLALLATDGTTQRVLDSADVARASCGVFWNWRGDSLYVWSTTPGTGLTSYAIDDATGKALGPPAPFRAPQPAAGERTFFSLSADGKRLAYVEHRLQRSVGVAELGTSIDVSSREAYVGTRDPRRPEISPAGNQFAYVSASDSGSALYVQDLAGGEPRRLTRAYREGLSGVRWSDDGKRLATLTRQDSQPVILILDALGAELQRVRPSHAVHDSSQFHRGYDWAAGGTGIMYNTMNAVRRRPEVRLIDLTSGQERLLLAGDGSNSEELSLPVWSPDGRSILYDSLGVLTIRDAATGAKRASPRSGPPSTPCILGTRPPCGTIVPVLWRADGTLFSESLDWWGSTTIWRSTMQQPPKVYAHLGKECKLVSLDREVRRVVCQVDRDESDVFVVTRP